MASAEHGEGGVTARIRKLTVEDVTICVVPECEDIDPEGQFDSGDKAADAKMAAQIREDMEHNAWAWCCARVDVTYRELTETEYLGCCSYENEAAFRGDHSYEGMVDAALARLNDQVEGIVNDVLVSRFDPYAEEASP